MKNPLSFVAVVSTLNINQYLGTWYQVYSDFFVRSTFEQNSRCVKAEYGLFPNNTISVHNSQINDDGKIQEIYGYAYQKDSGKLVVNLNGRDAPYWVLDLGPIVNDQYEYSIVSDPSQTSLFVLTRDVDQFFDEYDEEVLQKLKKLKFTNFRNKPIKTDQTNCNYVDK